MATNPRLPPPPSQNHVITAPPKGVVGGNRKKQKRRAKQAAKTTTDVPLTLDDGEPGDLDFEEDPLGYNDEDYGYSDADQYNNQYVPPHADANGYVAQSGASTKKKKKKAAKGGDIHHHHHHSPYNPELVGNHLPPIPSPPPPPIGSLRPDAKPGHGDIWNTSTQQERQNIKDFWLSLNEEERKSLLKIEKEAVLRKMKQQQKNSCSCTVCGRKRTAIEEELEVLYEGYYEELEQYAHHDQPPGLSTDEMIPGPLQHRKIPHPFEPHAPPNPLHKTSHLHEHLDDDEFSDEEDEDGYSDDDEDYSDEMLSSPIEARCAIPEFFNFGQNLTVKGILTPWLEKLQNGLKSGNADNILTVADDLLKNDGRKFIEMMESLAERRMQRESEAEYAAANPRHPGAYPPSSDSAYNQEDPLAAGDDYDDDDDASYNSQDDYDDDELEEAEDEVVSCDCRACRAEDASSSNNNGGASSHNVKSRTELRVHQSGLTAEQRMQEGRRMFQIFAARMFEQRVLTAYKEKVAAERQQKLLEELEDETKLEAQREAKKQRDAQKKKDKKKQAQAAKAEEKARKDAEKAAEEARVREAEEKKQEEQRRKKEEQRKKKEDEKRRQEEERARKEAEKNRRQQEEQQRREEVERKAKEQKAAEKAKKDEARKREREEREAREKEARDRKAQEEKEKSEREAKAKAKADKEARERDKLAQQAASQPQPPAQQPPQASKRSSQSGSVAVPAGAQSRQIPSAVPSPHPSVATPVIPKAPTPAAARQRQASQQNSLTSSPKQPQSQVSSAPSKSSSPTSSAPSSQLQQSIQNPNPISQKSGYQTQQPTGLPMQQHHHHAQSTSPLEHLPMQPPPGMSYPQQHQQPPKHSGSAFGGISPVGHPGLQGPHQNQHMMHGNMGARASPMPMYPPNQQMPNMGMQQNTRYGPPGINGQQSAGGAPQQARQGYPLDVQPGAGAFSAGFAQPQGHLSQPSAHQSSPPYQQPQVSSAAPGAEMQQQRSAIQSHSRQTSMTDKSQFDPIPSQPIARPAPIQRPSSVKPQEDVDDLSKHLGSSALLDDSDEPIPQGLAENRRQSNLAPGASRPNVSNLPPGMAPLPFGTPSGFGAPQNSWNSPSLPFGQSPTVGQQGWGLPTSTIGSWPGSNTGFANGTVGGVFGNIGHRSSSANFSRPLAIRLAICQACKHLSATGRGGPDGFHDVSLLLHTMNASRPPHEAPPSLREIEEICETEGDAQNGGGELNVRHSGGGFAVMWQPSFPGSTPDHQARAGIGEIGSPLPTKASPVGAGWGNAGAPGMVGMGRVPSGGNGGFQSFGAATGPTPPAGPGGS